MDYRNIDQYFPYDCTYHYQQGDICLYNGNRIMCLGYNKNNPLEKISCPVGDFDPRFWDGDFLKLII